MQIERENRGGPKMGGAVQRRGGDSIRTLADVTMETALYKSYILYRDCWRSFYSAVLYI